MLRIGHFAKITGVPIKTLRYYDQIGLLKPEQVDAFTGYRYYAIGQWRRLNRILVLKDLGLSLEQIEQVLTEDLPASELRGMLRLVQVHLEQEVNETQARLARVAKRVKQIEMEDYMSTIDVVIKEVAPIHIISNRQSSSEAFEPLFKEAYQTVITYAQTHKLKATGPMMGVFHEDPVDPEAICDFEVAFPVNNHAQKNEKIQAKTLPAVEKMATTLLQGQLTPEESDEVYDNLLQWIEDNGYVVDGPYREIFHQPEADGDIEALAEIQFPIRQVRE
ncbi:MAG: MerR family transcriptional regulator [Chloroflexota bacterium]